MVKITALEPISTRTSWAFVSRADGTSGLDQVDVPVFLDGPRIRGAELRHDRMMKDVTMGELARALDICVAQVSAVEMGEAFIEEGLHEWHAAIDRCADAKGGG